MAFSDVSAPLLAPDPPKDMLLRTVSAPLTPPADPAHDVDDLPYIPAATAPAAALVVVPSGSQPGSPQTFPEPAPRATAAVVGSGNKHGRKLDRPHRAPRERTLSSTPGVVFHLGAPSAEPADSAFEILEFLQSRQQERATYEAAAAAAAAAALVAAAPPAWEREDAHDHQHDHGDDGVEEEEEDDEDSAFTWTDDGDDGGVQEVPYALHGRYGSGAGAAAVGLGPVRARKPPARKAASLAMPHPTPARLSVFYPKNPKSDRGTCALEGRTGGGRACLSHPFLFFVCVWQCRAASRPTMATKSVLRAARRRRPTGVMGGTASCCATRAASALPSTACAACRAYMCPARTRSTSSTASSAAPPCPRPPASQQTHTRAACVACFFFCLYRPGRGGGDVCSVKPGAGPTCPCTAFELSNANTRMGTRAQRHTHK
jgi:hypothetical protein